MDKNNEIFYYSQKDHPEISRSAKFRGEMLWNTENLVTRSLQILYIFVLRGEKLPFSRQFQLKYGNFSHA